MMLEERKNIQLKSQLEATKSTLELVQRELSAKRLHLESAKCTLLVIEEKIKFAATTLAEYNKKLKGKKTLIRYYDGKR
jgi:hypothetical protein